MKEYEFLLKINSLPLNRRVQASTLHTALKRLGDEIEKIGFKEKGNELHIHLRRVWKVTK